MKKTHLPTRLLAMVLAFALLFGFATPVGATGSGETEVPFRQVDNSAVSVNSETESQEEEPAQPDYANTDVVRVSIFLEKASTVQAGYSTRGIAQNGAAMIYRAGLQASQCAMTASIERAIGEELDVVWNMTLAANAISANVEYGQIADIEKLPGVAEVVLETRYEPQESVTSAENQPNMVISSQMTGANVAWQSGYTGAGMRVAIIDTGLDIDHQSVDPDALTVALKEDAKNAGMSYDEYLTAIDLLDQEEIARVLPKLNASERYAGLTAQKLYVNQKAPFGFNYVDGNLELTHDKDTEGGHGSHVAGIAAANRYVKQNGKYVSAADSVYMIGNAPDAQIIVMKVFGQNGGAYDSDYMVAIEDAILLGCDSVNLSLGSSRPGEPHTDTYADIMESLTGTDTVVVTSMGNSGRWADNAARKNLYLDDVNTLTGGAPGTYANSLAVASVENDGIISSCFTVDGTGLIYLEDTTYGNYPFITLDTSEDGSGTEYEYVMIEGACNEADLAGIDVTGKIVVCSRGEIELYKKASNAVKAGAVGTILCNNEPGVFYADLYYYAKWYGYKQPCVSSTLSVAEYIRANGQQRTKEDGSVYYTGKMTVSGAYAMDRYDADTYTMSDFSSWGIPGDLTLKPEITAPGGNVFSINGEVAETDRYFLMSGTSMAAPQVSGITALVKQYIEENGLTQNGLTDRALAQSVLMSTATPLKDEDGQYYPVIQQGAGLVNAAAATGFDSYLLVDGQPDGKVKAELGDDPERNGVYTFDFDIHNVTGEAKSYELSADVFTQGFFVGYANYNAEYFEREDWTCLYMDTQTAPLAANTLWTVDGHIVSAAGELSLCDFNGDEAVNEEDGQALLDYVTGARETIQAADQADVDLDGDVDTYDVYLFLNKLGAETVTVPAGGSVQVSVTIKLTDAAKAHLDEYYKNGAYIQAYVYANAMADEEGVRGTSHSIPMLAFYGNWSDPSMFDHGIQQTYDTREQGYNADGENGRVPYLQLTDLYKGNLNTFMMTYVADPYNSHMLGGNPVTPDTRYLPERNAMNSENGDYVSKIKATVIRNAAASRYTITNTDTGEVLKDTDLGMIYASYFHGLMYDPVAYTLPGGWNPGGLPEGTHLELALTLAPDYYVNDDGSVRWDELGRGAALKTPVVIDNTAPVVEGIYLDVLNDTLNVKATDNQFVSAVSLYNASGVKFLAQAGSNADAQAGDTCEFVLDVSEVDGQKFLVQVTDYAMNTVTYQIEVDLGETEVPSRIAFDLSRGTWVGFDQTTTFQTLTTWMPSNETFYAGVWMDHLLLASTNQGRLYVMPENDPSDLNYVGKMDVVLTDMAYNAADGELYGVSGNKLYTVNRLNGDVAEVGRIGVTTNTLACDANGTFYSQKLETGEVYSYTLETMDAPELLVNVGKNSMSIQGLEIDPNTGMLCWNSCREEHAGGWSFTYGYYFEINPATGEYKQIVDLWDNLACLMIPEKTGGDSSWTEPVDTVDGVEISRDTLELLPGSSGKLSATVTPWTASDRTVTWSTSDAGVATVSEEGVVTGVSEGVCTITAASSLDGSVTASCTVTVSEVKMTLEGILMDQDEQTKRFTWNTEDESGWKAGANLSIGMTAATLDTDRNQLVVLDSYFNTHLVDPETGKILKSAEVTLGIPMGDMAYSTVFSTEDTPMVSSIYGSIFLTPQNPLEPSGLGFDLGSRLILAGADSLAALTSLGYEQYYVEATGTMVDAEHLVLLDDVGNVWNMWLYSNGNGGMSAMVDYYPSTMRVLDFPGISGMLFCSMAAGEDGCLYVSYFDGNTCQMYRLSFDPIEKMYMADLLGELGDGVWPASIYAANSNVRSTGVNGFAPTGMETELQAEENVVEALNADAATAPTGTLNALAGSSEQYQVSKPEASCKDNTVTLTVTADAETTNGLYTVAYDASKLTLTGKSAKCQLSSFNEEAGLVTFGYAGKTALPEGSALVTLTFKIAEGSEASVTVTKAQENAAHPETAENITLTPAGHSWGQWETTTEADCFRDGLMTRTCAVCGKTETKVIPAGSDHCPSKAFSDLNCTAWYHEGVDYVLSTGLMNGMGNGIFAPNKAMTRGMIVTILYRMAGEPEVKTKAPFVDVPENSYYADAVAWAYGNKVVLGVSRDRFAPNSAVTREQLVVLLYRYAEFANLDVTARGSMDSFKDKDAVSDYARSAMAWAVGEGLLIGDNGRLLPKNASTRAQIATILCRFLED